MTLPPEKFREDLINVDAHSVTAGNLTGACKSHIALPEMAVQARREADSVEI